MALSSSIAADGVNGIGGSKLPPDESYKILIAHGWNPVHAQAITKRIEVLYNKDFPFTAFFSNWCPGDIATSKLEYLEHEYHHAWDWRECKYILQNVRADMLRMAADAAMSDVLFLVRVNINNDVHLNHQLAEWLKYDYSRIPEWYRKKYFGYTIYHPVFVPMLDRGTHGT